ncbi:MAG: 50S ribosomal protein L24 [Firmicutes bacterium]|nr:50S ribosomal protein L24 [Bacillota bacterium]
MSANKLHVRKGDRVLVLSGKDKGRKAKVITAYPRKNKVLVEGVNMVKKHARPTQKVPQGGIRETEAPIYACKVMVICPSCQKPTRLARRELSGGKKVRACKKCGEIIDK